MPPKGMQLRSIERGWSEEQLAYMRWKCWPESDLDPQYQTKQGIADLLGVETDTIRNWERLPGWELAVEAMADEVIFLIDYKIKKNMLNQLLSSKINDKVFMTLERYIKPALVKHRTERQRFIQLKGDDTLKAEDHREELTKEIMNLPPDVMDIVLSYWRRLLEDPASGEAQVLPEVKSYDFTRVPKAQTEEPIKVKVTPLEKGIKSKMGKPYNRPMTFLPDAIKQKIENKTTEEEK